MSYFDKLSKAAKEYAKREDVKEVTTAVKTVASTQAGRSFLRSGGSIPVQISQQQTQQTQQTEFGWFRNELIQQALLKEAREKGNIQSEMPQGYSYLPSTTLQERTLLSTVRTTQVSDSESRQRQAQESLNRQGVPVTIVPNEKAIFHPGKTKIPIVNPFFDTKTGIPAVDQSDLDRQSNLAQGLTKKSSILDVIFNRQNPELKDLESRSSQIKRALPSTLLSLQTGQGQGTNPELSQTAPDFSLSGLSRPAPTIAIQAQQGQKISKKVFDIQTTKSVSRVAKTAALYTAGVGIGRVAANSLALVSKIPAIGKPLSYAVSGLMIGSGVKATAQTGKEIGGLVKSGDVKSAGILALETTAITAGSIQGVRTSKAFKLNQALSTPKQVKGTGEVITKRVRSFDIQKNLREVVLFGKKALGESLRLSKTKTISDQPVGAAFVSKGKGFSQTGIQFQDGSQLVKTTRTVGKTKFKILTIISETGKTKSVVFEGSKQIGIVKSQTPKIYGDFSSTPLQTIKTGTTQPGKLIEVSSSSKTQKTFSSNLRYNLKMLTSTKTETKVDISTKKAGKATKTAITKVFGIERDQVVSQGTEKKLLSSKKLFGNYELGEKGSSPKPVDKFSFDGSVAKTKENPLFRRTDTTKTTTAFDFQVQKRPITDQIRSSISGIKNTFSKQNIGLFSKKGQMQSPFTIQKEKIILGQPKTQSPQPLAVNIVPFQLSVTPLTTPKYMFLKSTVQTPSTKKISRIIQTKSIITSSSSKVDFLPSSRTATSTKTDQRTASKLAQSLIQKQQKSTKTTTTLKSLSMLTTRTVTTTETPTQTPIKTIIPYIPIPPQIPNLPNIPAISLSGKREPKNIFGRGYIVKIRRGGFFRTVAAGLSRSEALTIGSRVAGNTLARSFKIEQSGRIRTKGKKGAFDISKFNLKKGIFIEKGKYALSSKGERKEINWFRRKKLK